jgi:hypothetical protein
MTCVGGKLRTACNACGGEGVHSRVSGVSITIPAGVEDGQALRLLGKGDAIRGGKPGHLDVVLAVQRHPRFTRQGGDLIVEIEIAPELAASGGRVTVPLLVGERQADVRAGAKPVIRSCSGDGVCTSWARRRPRCPARPARRIARSEPGGRRHEASPLRDRAAAARRAFNRADALVVMAQGYLRGDRPERSPVEVVVSIPVSSLRAGAALDPVEVGEMGESFLSGETARRLSCDAGVVDVVHDDQGVPLSVGRKRRTIAGALQRALRRRDTACTFPGCTNRIFLEGHHIQHWADGGETSLQNTALLCTLHHRYVHEYGYVIELGPDQRPRFRDPHGRWVAAVPERPRVADLGWPRIRAENEALEIDADTIAGPWDGTLVDYGRIVGHLATVDRLA